MIIYFNGAFLEPAGASIAYNDRGFTLGDGVFDTMRARDGAPVFADLHFARLTRHAGVLGIPLTQTLDELTAIAAELLRHNPASGDQAIRTTLSRGAGARGLAPPDGAAPTLIMSVSPAPAISGDARLIIAQSTRRNELSPLSRIKSTQYGDNMLALMEARRAGADDAILLNNKGNVACATTSNIFILEGDTLYAPPCADGALDGVMRALLIDKMAAREETISKDRALNADQIFLTNSLTGPRRAHINGDKKNNMNAEEMLEKLKRVLQPS